MLTVKIKRLETGDQGTFGRFIAGDLQGFTGELPDRDNAKGLSRIPEGTYKCIWVFSPHFRKWKYSVQNVPGRAGVLIHAGNFMGDINMGYKSHLQGCIALSERIGYIEKQKALLLSIPMIRRFEDMLNAQPFVLEIE
jgi:hypothetical protein